MPPLSADGENDRHANSQTMSTLSALITAAASASLLAGPQNQVHADPCKYDFVVIAVPASSSRGSSTSRSLQMAITTLKEEWNVNPQRRWLTGSWRIYRHCAENKLK
jgi:hypothetical protein